MNVKELATVKGVETGELLKELQASGVDVAQWNSTVPDEVVQHYLGDLAATGGKPAPTVETVTFSDLCSKYRNKGWDSKRIRQAMMRNYGFVNVYADTVFECPGGVDPIQAIEMRADELTVRVLNRKNIEKLHAHGLLTEDVKEEIRKGRNPVSVILRSEINPRAVVTGGDSQLYRAFDPDARKSRKFFTSYSMSGVTNVLSIHHWDNFKRRTTLAGFNGAEAEASEKDQALPGGKGVRVSPVVINKNKIRMFQFREEQVVYDDEVYGSPFVLKASALAPKGLTKKDKLNVKPKE